MDGSLFGEGRTRAAAGSSRASPTFPADITAASPPSAARRDAYVIAMFLLVAFGVIEATGACRAIIAMLYHGDDIGLDGAMVTAVLASAGLAIFAWRRWREMHLEVAARELAEANAQQVAAHDALTGLPNRRRLQEELGQALARVDRGVGSAALLMVDLDRFKPVNDVHGHLAGDRLLQEVAGRLRINVRDGDTVARLGGDEFAIIAALATDDPSEEASRLARRLVAALETSFALPEATVQIGCSIGLAIAPQDARDAGTLMRRADLALYRAKAEGRGCFRFFEAEMDERIRERAALESDLRLAIARDELEPHFQPLVSIDTGRLLGFEVLARWTHAERGDVPPTEFVNIAEDTGLIVPLTEKLLRKACRVAARWPEELSVAVNVSPVQLRDRALPESISRILAEVGMPAQRLEVELTESALIGNLDLAREILTDLKTLGVRLSLDDFGTGYSSLAHLQALPFDKIKIDARFVRAMNSDVGSRKIVAAVVGLGHSLGLPTVAEGVEEKRDAEALRQLGCDAGQGWLFGRPLPVAEVERMLALRVAAG